MPLAVIRLIVLNIKLESYATHLFPCVGVRESAINRAEGLRQSKILASEAMQIEQVNKARGELTTNVNIQIILS